MGEQKRRRRLRDLLGEWRGDGFDEMVVEIAATAALDLNEQQRDSLRFFELFSVAAIEGLNERLGTRADAARCFEAHSAMAQMMGVAAWGAVEQGLSPDADMQGRADLITHFAECFARGMAHCANRSVEGGDAPS